MSQAYTYFSERFHMTLSSSSSNMSVEMLLAFEFWGAVWDKGQSFRKYPEIFEFYSLVTSDVDICNLHSSLIHSLAKPYKTVVQSLETLLFQGMWKTSWNSQPAHKGKGIALLTDRPTTWRRNWLSMKKYTYIWYQLLIFLGDSSPLCLMYTSKEQRFTSQNTTSIIDIYFI